MRSGDANDKFATVRWCTCHQPCQHLYSRHRRDACHCQWQQQLDLTTRETNNQTRHKLACQCRRANSPLRTVSSAERWHATSPSSTILRTLPVFVSASSNASGSQRLMSCTNNIFKGCVLRLERLAAAQLAGSRVVGDGHSTRSPLATERSANSTRCPQTVTRRLSQLLVSLGALLALHTDLTLQNTKYHKISLARKAGRR